MRRVVEQQEDEPLQLSLSVRLLSVRRPWCDWRGTVFLLHRGFSQKMKQIFLASGFQTYHRPIKITVEETQDLDYRLSLQAFLQNQANISSRYVAFICQYSFLSPKVCSINVLYFYHVWYLANFAIICNVNWSFDPNWSVKTPQLPNLP